MTDPARSRALPRTVLTRFLVPAGLYLIALVVLTWPAAAAFDSAFLCGTGDGLQNVWNLWWIDFALTDRHTWPLWTAWLHHPEGVTLIAQTMNPFNGLIGIPLSRLLGEYAVHNSIVAFSFVMTGVTAFWLGLRVVGSYWPSVFCGAAFTFSSYHFAHAYGHLQLVSLEWVPLFLLLWLRLLDSGRVRTAIAAGLTLLLVTLCAYDYTLHCVMAGAVLLLHRVLRRGGAALLLERWRALAVFAAVAVATVGPFVAGILIANHADPFEGSHDANRFCLDLLAPFVPGADWRFAEWTEGFWRGLAGNPVEASAYFRWSVLAAAACGLASRAERSEKARWAVLAAVFGAVALGPQLHIAGTAYPAVPMPYSALETVFPPLRLSGSAVRMVVIAMLGVTMLAGMGLPALWRRGGWPLRLAFAALFAFESWPYELPQTRVPLPRYVTALAALPPGAVAGLDGEPLDLYAQTRFEKPMTRGYVTRLPRSRRIAADEKQALLDAGRYRELLDRADCRYLVLPRSAAGTPDGLRAAFRGDLADVFVRADDDDAGTAEVPAPIEVRVERDPATGAPVALHVTAPADAHRRFQVGLALATEPAQQLPDGREIPLAEDDLFRLTTDAGRSPLRDNPGMLDGLGRGTVTLRSDHLPDPAAGPIHYCVAIYDPRAPAGVCRISAAGVLR